MLALASVPSSPAEERPRERKFVLLARERIDSLPDSERKIWREYLERSQTAFAREVEVLAAECRAAGLGRAKPAPGNRAEFEIDGNAKLDWFAGPQAQELVQAIISYQTPTGGWSKAVDYSKGTRSPGTHWTSQTGDAWHYCGTLDNRSTTEQIMSLADSRITVGVWLLHCE